MASHENRLPPASGNIAISILRVILWLLPSIIVPLGFLLTKLKPLPWPLMVIVTLAVLAVIGYIDQRLLLHKDRIDPSIKRLQTIDRTCFFVIIQVFLGPIILVIAAFALTTIHAFFR